MPRVLGSRSGEVIEYQGNLSGFRLGTNLQNAKRFNLLDTSVSTFDTLPFESRRSAWLISLVWLRETISGWSGFALSTLLIHAYTQSLSPFLLFRLSLLRSCGVIRYQQQPRSIFVAFELPLLIRDESRSHEIQLDEDT
jgi:hypothetical protein